MQVPGADLIYGEVNGQGTVMGLGGSEVEKGLLADVNAAFIVRVWIEPREIAGAPVEWRGSVEHVASGGTRYLTELDQIAQFIWPFLRAMGVDSADHQA